MRSEERSQSNPSKPRKRRINYELYYYEQVGSRIYFRITRFFIIFITVTLILGLAAMGLYTHLAPGDSTKNVNKQPVSTEVRIRPVA
jgi:hypothetical protein